MQYRKSVLIFFSISGLVLMPTRSLLFSVALVGTLFPVWLNIRGWQADRRRSR